MDATRLPRGVRLALLIFTSSFASGASTPEIFVIGGFDSSRSGEVALADGAFLAGFRELLDDRFPGASVRAFPEVTPKALAEVNIVFLASASGCCAAITPLSVAEQTALRSFVDGGGCAIIVSDNDRYAGAQSDAANESVIDPFDLDISGTIAGGVTATVADPESSPITNGPFGGVETFEQNFPGAFDNIGPATALAENAIGTAVAVIEPGALGPRSGSVVLFSDLGSFGGGLLVGSTAALVQNTIQYAAGTCNQGEIPPPLAVCKEIFTVSASERSCGAGVNPMDLDGGSTDPDGGTLRFSLEPPGPYSVGMNAVTLRVSSSRGSSSTCPATIEVVDDTPPTITCPNDVTITSGTGEAVEFESPVVMDNCEGVTVEYSPASGTLFPVGTTTVTSTATDPSGNTATCTFAVTVVCLTLEECRQWVLAEIPPQRVVETREDKKANNAAAKLTKFVDGKIRKALDKAAIAKTVEKQRKQYEKLGEKLLPKLLTKMQKFGDKGVVAEANVASFEVAVNQFRTAIQGVIGSLRQ